jgi:hypothetical protein
MSTRTTICVNATASGKGEQSEFLLKYYLGGAVENIE